MNLDRMGQVIEISLPIFALIFLGMWLRKKKVLTSDQLGGINWILFNLSLPALLLRAIAPQDFSSLYQPAIIVGSLLPVSLCIIFFLCLSVPLGIHRPLKGPFVAGAVWANASYMGFPLALSAFGEKGLVYAAIANSFAMPSFIISGVLLYSFAGRKGVSFSWRELLKTVFNPVINAVILGLLISWVISIYGHPSEGIMVGVNLADRILEPLGQLGLPMALIAVGASLNFGAIDGKWGPLLLSIFGKLMITPLLGWLIVKYGFPECDREALGVAVLILGTPCAVASFVVSRKMNVEPEFVSAQMVLSTVLSVFSIPIWLYFLV
jgi:predicted permease